MSSMVGYYLIIFLELLLIVDTGVDEVKSLFYAKDVDVLFILVLFGSSYL